MIHPYQPYIEEGSFPVFTSFTLLVVGRGYMLDLTLELGVYAKDHSLVLVTVVVWGREYGH